MNTFAKRTRHWADRFWQIFIEKEFFSLQTIGGNAGGPKRNAVSNIIYFPEKHRLGFASALPRPEINYLSLVKPLTLAVWMATVASVFLSGIVLNTIYRLESLATGMDFGVGIWKTRAKSVWYCFGVLWGGVDGEPGHLKVERDKVQIELVSAIASF